MGLEGDLNSISSALGGQAAELEEKIRRLKQANGEVMNEQTAGLSEIKQIKLPELADQWTGNRATGFDEKRTDAYDEMNRIFQWEYEAYQQEIERKIWMLEAELAAIRSMQAMASEIGDLLGKGEEMLEQAGDRLASLKGRLFG